MVLQSFVGLWPLIQFRNHFYTHGRTPWTSDQPVARRLPTHRTKQTQNKRTHKHPYFKWDSNSRSQRSSERNSLCLRPRGHCDRRRWYITLKITVFGLCPSYGILKTKKKKKTFRKQIQLDEVRNPSNSEPILRFYDFFFLVADVMLTTATFLIIFCLT
jgi:hypothetical protein